MLHRIRCTKEASRVSVHCLCGWAPGLARPRSPANRQLFTGADPRAVAVWNSSWRVVLVSAGLHLKHAHVWPGFRE